MIELDLSDASGAGLDEPVVRRAVEAVVSRAAPQLEGRDLHVGVAFVDADRIRALNRRHRGRDSATDVLSFPVDGRVAVAGPHELGDIVICPEHCADQVEALVHGALHLVGYDHETDAGEMIALQRQLVAEL